MNSGKILEIKSDRKGRDYDAPEYHGYIVTDPSIWIHTLDRL